MRATIRSQSKRSKWVIYPTLILALVNFFVFIYYSLSLGGDALNGYIDGTHYFLCAHGGCVEVSRSIWTYSYWHAISAFIGIALVFVEFGIFVMTKDIVVEYAKRSSR
jgi:hypothetical protein